VPHLRVDTVVPVVVAVSRAKTTAQWRREVPAYDTAIRAVEAAVKGWPAGRAPRMIAHLHPDTHVVSIILDGSEGDTRVADVLLTSTGYRRGWEWDASYPRAVWRKTVSS